MSSTREGATSLLLQVQDHDTAIDQLRHRREAMAPKGELEAVRARMAELDSSTRDSRAQRKELTERQAVLEEQIERSRARRAEIEKRMFAGSVTASRELQAMDEEVRHLVRHISELEDREIEVMEEIEPLDGVLQAADVEQDALENRALVLTRTIIESEVSIDAELEAEQVARDGAAASVPEGLLARYETLRRKLGGTGAARLVGSSCSGCHLVLPSMEVERIRRAPPDEIVTCEQCGRILVH